MTPVDLTDCSGIEGQLSQWHSSIGTECRIYRNSSCPPLSNALLVFINDLMSLRANAPCGLALSSSGLLHS